MGPCLGLSCTQASVRDAAGVGWQEDDEVDYDLDEQDRQWLSAFNHGQERLPYRRMELLLWRLDTANAEATDSAFASKPFLRRLCSSCHTFPHEKCISVIMIQPCHRPSHVCMQLLACVTLTSKWAHEHGTIPPASQLPFAARAYGA